MTTTLLRRSVSAIPRLRQYRSLGMVKRVRGLVIEAQGPRAAVGDMCTVATGARRSLAEVVGFDGNVTLLMPLEDVHGLVPGAEVEAHDKPVTIGVSPQLIGRVINGLGHALDGGGPIPASEYRPLQNAAPHPLRRAPVTRPLSVGVRAIDGLLTLGEGQRIGIFAGSGVGKSVLLGMMAKYTEADVVVVGLIGERGREVRDFIEKYLGSTGARKTVVVAETSDRWPLLRIKGMLAATTIAEYFRDQGLRVLLLMDSVTRVCHALREVGLSLGEPPATRGYPPSVFAMMPKILERSGNSHRGSISAFYTVLVEGDDMNDPVADTVRSVLDGHIILSRKLAARHHLPAIDVLASVSRVMPDVVSREHYAAAAGFKEWLSAYEEAEDLISIGAYAKGSRKLVDEAIEHMPAMEAFLRQDLNEEATMVDTIAGLQRITQRS